METLHKEEVCAPADLSKKEQKREVTERRGHRAQQEVLSEIGALKTPQEEQGMPLSWE